jgi:hypothetical protein
MNHIYVLWVLFHTLGPVAHGEQMEWRSVAQHNTLTDCRNSAVMQDRLTVCLPQGVKPSTPANG